MQARQLCPTRLQLWNGVWVSPGAESLPLPSGSHLAQSWLLHLLPSQEVPEKAFLQRSLCCACSPRISSEEARFFPKETISGKCPRIYLLYTFSSKNSILSVVKIHQDFLNWCSENLESLSAHTQKKKERRSENVWRFLFAVSL